MKITILGSGSAFGVPMIFNNWGKTNPDNPKNERMRASIFIEEQGKSILIDAGPELRIQTNRFNIQNIEYKKFFIENCNNHKNNFSEYCKIEVNSSNYILI